MKNSSLRLPLYACLLLIAACEKHAEVVFYDDKALADESQTANWLAYGRTHNERRFSPSDQINTGNVAKLKVDWFLDLPSDVGLVSTPLVVDGTVYFTGTMNVIRAVDAATGELLWEYDPKVADAIRGKRQAGWKHNRGISFYEGKLFAATWAGSVAVSMSAAPTAANRVDTRMSSSAQSASAADCGPPSTITLRNMPVAMWYIR